jgi:hypothetical protein
LFDVLKQQKKTAIQLKVRAILRSRTNLRWQPHRTSKISTTETGSNLCVELGMGTKHAVQGSGTVSFWLESREVLSVSNVLWVPKRRSVLSVSEIEKKGYHILFRDGQVLFAPRRFSFRSAMVLGVKEGNLYWLRGQPMQAVTSSSRETDEE